MKSVKSTQELMEKLNDAKKIINDGEEILIEFKPVLEEINKIYKVPFDKTLKIIEEDRKRAIENYNMYLNMIETGDDSNSAKEGLNNAMSMIIKSTDKLNNLVLSASKIVSESLKAFTAIKKTEKMEELNPVKNQEMLNEIRAEIVKGDK